MKKLIGLFAVLAVMSVVGCGGAKDGDKKDEQKAPAARPIGLFKATSYTCENGSEPLSNLGQYGGMTFLFSENELVFTMAETQEEEVNNVDIDVKWEDEYTMDATITDASVSCELKSTAVFKTIPGTPREKKNLLPLYGSIMKNIKASYTLDGNKLTLTIDEDALCSTLQKGPKGPKGRGTIVAEK